MFIDDLLDVVESYVKIFADNTKIFTHVQSKDDYSKLQKNRDSLSLWSDRWQLKLNVELYALRFPAGFNMWYVRRR